MSAEYDTYALEKTTSLETAVQNCFSTYMDGTRIKLNFCFSGTSAVGFYSFFLRENRNAKKPLLCFSYEQHNKARARSSVRLEHRTFNPRVAGSIPVGPALTFCFFCK
jgi:hypothetical protein